MSMKENGGDVMLTMKQVAQALRNNGYKVTPQRLAVYESLSHTHEHPTAEILYSGLQDKYPSMSLSTVYKTMDILEKLRLVRIMNAGEDSARYDAETGDHQHIRCLVCSRVDDVEIDAANVQEQAEHNSGYEVQRQDIYFYGICPQCRAANGEKKD